MTPELGLAINEGIVVNITLLEKLYIKVKQVFKFKQQCESLYSDAQALQRLVEANKDTVDKLESTTQFKQVLTEIIEFVASFEDAALRKAILDVFIKKQYPFLKGKLLLLKEKLTFESQMTTASKINMISSSLQPSNDQQSIWNILASLKELVEQDRKKTPLRSAIANMNLKPDHTLDSRFQISRTQEPGEWVGTAEDMGRVLLKEIPVGGNTSLYLKTYKDLQAGSFVQRYFGTILVEDKLYAIMQHFGNETSLSSAIQDGSLAGMALAQRVGFVCDIAKTVAWFHAAEMLLKSLTEDTIILHRDEDGTIHPILVGLQASRKFMERTTSQEQDVRYEAPEYKHMKQHTIHTDEWSLGTVIWQILTAKHPFGLNRAVYRSEAESQTIISRIEAEVYPGDYNDLDQIVHEKVVEVVQACWHRDGMLRPPALSIAQSLLSVFAAINVSQPTMELVIQLSTHLRSRSLSIQAQFLEKIRKARMLNDKKTDVMEPSASNKISSDDLRFLLQDEAEWDPVKLFVVGAAIWWKLIEYEVQDEDSGFGSIKWDHIERRGVNALGFLDAAASSGCSEAHYERHKIYWQLSRSARLKYEESCVNVA